MPTTKNTQPVTLNHGKEFSSFSSLWADKEGDTRIWVHPLFRDLADPRETDWVESRLREMTQGWTAHQKPVPGEFLIHRNRFVIVANPHEISGCGIDASFRVLAEINRYLGGDPANLLYYLDGDTLHSLPRYQLKPAIASGKITPQTTVINLPLTSLKELREGLLELPAERSFLSDYFIV